jgi:hypothetical protein
MVDDLDYHFIIMNFLSEDKDLCCPGSGGPADALENPAAFQPITSISNAELAAKGLRHIAEAADLDKDGDVDTDDMAAFQNGVVQTPQTGSKQAVKK